MEKKKRIIIFIIISFVAGLMWSLVTGVNWLHEIGHVVFSIVSGEPAYIISGSLTALNHTPLIDIGGALFVMLFAIPVLFICLKKNAVLWIGSFFYGKAITDAFVFFGSPDMRNSGITAGAWTLIVFLYIAITVIMVLWLAVKNKQQIIDAKKKTVYNVG